MHFGSDSDLLTVNLACMARNYVKQSYGTIKKKNGQGSDESNTLQELYAKNNRNYQENSRHQQKDILGNVTFPARYLPPSLSPYE